MPYERCKDCGAFLFSSTRDAHRCPPRWRVWSPEYHGDPEDASVIYAHDEQDAVTEWAENQDENYTLIDSPETVRVMPEDDFPRSSEWKTFIVRGEATIDFYATEIQGTD